VRAWAARGDAALSGVPQGVAVGSSRLPVLTSWAQALISPCSVLVTAAASARSRVPSSS
jgi:hypothetical protein